MDFKPGLPEHNDNITDEHPLKDFTLLLAGLAAIFVLIYFLLGLLVDYSVGKITPEQESRWFFNSELSNHITRSLADETMPELFDFDAFEQLKQCAGVDVPIQLMIHESELVNAVAIPGGNIIIFSGLIEQIYSQNGLAFVIAHELAHFKHRDHLRGMGRGIVLVGLTAFATGGKSTLTHLIGSLSGFEQSRHSKSRERDADLAALSILACTYGHVGGATEFFESMAAEEGGMVAKFSHYFASHPEAAERVSAMNEMIGRKAFRVDAVNEWRR